MTEIKTPSNIVKGRVVTLDQLRADNALIDSSRQYPYGVHYKYERETLPRHIDVKRFNEGERNNEAEVKILQNAVRCLKAMYICLGDKCLHEDTSILDEYASDTLLTFDYDTGKNIFDEETFEKDSNEHKNKQRALIAEYNKIVASTTLANAIENATKLHQIKNKIDELRATQPKKDDEKYNHHEIVKGSTSVKQALDRYKELCDLRNKYEQEWEQHGIDYQRSRAGKLNVSEDAFKIFKELYKAGAFRDTSGPLCAAASRYESVKDYNENNWKEVPLFDVQDESRKFLNQKQLKLWQKYGRYVVHPYTPSSDAIATEWMMYEQFNDNDLMWLRSLKAFGERVIALKRIEEQNSSK